MRELHEKAQGTGLRVAIVAARYNELLVHQMIEGAHSVLLDAGVKPGQERKPILAVNNFYAMLRAVISGLGIAALSDFIATEHSDLVRVLPELTGPPIEAYFVYPEELRASKRISVFRDFLLRKVAETRLS